MENRVAIVSGGSLGIGKETCRKLIKQGAKVVAVGRNEKRLKDLIEEFRPLGEIDGVKADVTVASEAESLAGNVFEKYGRIDVLVNNVGGSLGLSGKIEDIPEEMWNKTIQSNLNSVYFCCKYTIPYMKKAKYGRIVNVSSIAGRGRSFFGSTAYSAVKAAIFGFTRQATNELGEYNITINAVAPGVVMTDRVKNFWFTRKTEEERLEYLKSLSIKRLATPEEIAAGIAFFCSDEASYITGAVLDINGGGFVG